MKNKLLLTLFILLTLTISGFTQTNNQVTFEPCEFLVISSFPQLLLGRNLPFSETQAIRAQAISDGIILNNGKVVNKEELANRVFRALNQTELALHFGANSPEGSTLVGYILEMSSNNVKHYVLTGTNREPLYNPCNASGSITSTQAVYVYAR